MSLATARRPLRRSGTTRPRSAAAVFFQQFLKHPVMIGSVIPSSRRLIARMLAPVDWSGTRLFVEYGPGVGTFCRHILQRLPADATYIAIDTNRAFIDYLRDDIVDPRFIAVHGSAAEVERIVRDHGHAAADYVLSGLPFSTLPEGIGPAIAAATHRVLQPGGTFLVYQFSPKCRAFLTPHFDRIDHGFEAWNIPPAQLYWARKDASGVDVQAPGDRIVEHRDEKVA